MLIFIRSLAVWVALVSFVPNFVLAQEPAATAPQISPASGGEVISPLQCFDWYRFGSVQANIQPTLSTTVSGSVLSFAGTVINENEYPLVDGTLYVKIFREESEVFAEGDGNVVVDQFVIATDIALPANGAKDISYDWRVPVNAITGDYYAAYFFATSDRYNLMGLSFTDDVVGNTAHFSVLGEEGVPAPVELSKTDTTINGLDHHFAAFPLHFNFAEPIEVKTTVTNPTSQSKTLPIQWTQYAWDGLLEDNVRNVKTSLLTLAPNETKEISYQVKPQGEAVVFVNAVVQDIQAKSYLNVRFVQDGVEETRINFPSLSKFPLEAGVEQTLFACAHSTNVPLVEGNTLTLELSDASGKIIHSYTYEGAITGEMAGFGDTFTPKASYDYVTLTATLERRGEVVESVSVVYDCAVIAGEECQQGEGDAQASGDISPAQLVIMAVGIVILVLIVIIVSVLVRKKGPGPTTVAMFLLFAFVATLFSSSATIVEAKTVSWNTTDASGTYYYKWGWFGYQRYGIDSTDGGTGWAPALTNPNYTVTYGANVYNDSSGGTLLSDGSSIAVGTVLRFEPKPHTSSDISWYGTGYSSDSPNGDWVTNAAVSHQSPDQLGGFGAGACRNQDSVGSIPANTGGNWDVFIPVSVHPPTISVSHGGTAGLSCNAGNTTCTVTTPGTINSTFTFAQTYAKLYYRYRSTESYTFINPKADPNNCDSGAIRRIDPGLGSEGANQPCTFQVAANSCFGDNTPLSKNQSSDFTLTVPQQTVAFTFIATGGSNANPNPPTITGPATGNTNASLQYNFVATDPDGDTIFYEVDWDNNGTVDARVPGSSLVNSGTAQSATRSWGTTGTKTFQARTADVNNNRSTWASFSVTINNAPSCSTVGYSANTVAEFTSFSNQCVSDGYTVLEMSNNVEYGDLPLIQSNQKCLVTQDLGTGWRARLYANPSCGVPASPFATISGSGCTIASGASTCNGSLSWDIINATSPNVQNQTTATNVSNNANGSSVSVALRQGANNFVARDGSNTLNSKVLTASCVSGTSWNGTSCASSGGSCTWSYDSSTDDFSAASSNSNMTCPSTGYCPASVTSALSGQPATPGSPNVCILSCSISGWNRNMETMTKVGPGCSVPPSTSASCSTAGIVYTADNSTEATTYSQSCTSQGYTSLVEIGQEDAMPGFVSSPTPGTCTVILPNTNGATMYRYTIRSVPNCSAPVTSATISGTGCTIPAGASACSGLLTWDIANATAPLVINTTSNNAYSSLATGNSFAAPLQYGSNMVEARDGSTRLNSVSLTATCAVGSTWDGSTCVAPPSTTCSPIGSQYRWNGSNWDDYSVTPIGWSMTDIGMTASTPPGAYSGPQDMGFGVTRTMQGGVDVMSCDAIPLTTVDLQINGTNGPVTVDVGDTLNLNWTASGVSSCSAFGAGWSNGGNVPLNGNTAIPANTAGNFQYILNCDGNLDFVDVTVTASVNPPTASLQVSVGGAPWSSDSPQSMTQGQTLAVQWSSVNADSCTGTNVTTGTLTSGTDTGVPKPPAGSSLSYSVTCTNASGSDTATIQVDALQLANLTRPSLSASIGAGFDAVTGMYDFAQASFNTSNGGATDITVSTQYVLQLDLNNDGSIDMTRTGTLNPMPNVNALPAGSNIHPIVTDSFTTIPFGSHRVIVTVDSNNDVVESNETDNQNSVSLTVPPPDPGLTLNIEPSTLIRSGSSVELEWSVANAYPTLECTLSGPALTAPHTIDPFLGSGVRTTGPITAKSDYTLSCRETITNTVFSATQSVETTGTVEEI